MNVLIAYDGSDGAKRGLEEGLRQFGRAAALVLPEEKEERRGQLAEAGQALAERGISAELVERSGDPAIAILDEAEKEGSDLIVMGTRGVSAIQRWLLGSVSSKVLHHARCSVLVAR